MGLNVKQVAEFLMDGLKAGLQDREKARLIVSGGSSPVPVFDILRQTDFAWDRVIISLVDERGVPADHDDSNHKLIKEHLHIDKAAAASFVPLYDNEAAQQDIGAPLDAMLLGMGTDGHFASLFPAMIDDEVAFSLDAAPQIIKTRPLGNPEHPRISMNMAMICQSAHICLILTSDEKMALFESAKTDDSLPIHHLYHNLTTDLVVFSA